eukprot:6211822-Pleurochrysis_carterae.AAC.2
MRVAQLLRGSRKQLLAQYTLSYGAARGGRMPTAAALEQHARDARAEGAGGNCAQGQSARKVECAESNSEACESDEGDAKEGGGLAPCPNKQGGSSKREEGKPTSTISAAEHKKMRLRRDLARDSNKRLENAHKRSDARRKRAVFIAAELKVKSELQGEVDTMHLRASKSSLVGK